MRGILIGRRIPKGIPFPAPDHIAGGVRGEPWGIEIVGVQVSQDFPCGGLGDLGDGHVVGPDIGPDQGTGGVGFLQEMTRIVVVIQDRACGG